MLFWRLHADVPWGARGLRESQDQGPQQPRRPAWARAAGGLGGRSREGPARGRGRGRGQRPSGLQRTAAHAHLRPAGSSPEVKPGAQDEPPLPARSPGQRNAQAAWGPVLSLEFLAKAGAGRAARPPTEQPGWQTALELGSHSGRHSHAPHPACFSRHNFPATPGPWGLETPAPCRDSQGGGRPAPQLPGVQGSEADSGVTLQSELDRAPPYCECPPSPRAGSVSFAQPVTSQRPGPSPKLSEAGRCPAKF